MIGPMVRCPCCSGNGVIELTGVYLETLVLLRQQDEEVTAADLSKRDGCNATAMNNRLAALERLGLATSRRYGRKRLFKVER